jgi:two-component system, OmpR family, alkaline phosphatase synthesis response regulator PhoP
MEHVLIVEDEQHLADGLRFNLEAEGYFVKVVDNGEAALELIREGKQKVELMLLDVMLPGISGFEVAHELRSARNFLPILMLTARGRPDDVVKGFESGADDYLQKPFDLGVLFARVRALLRRKAWIVAPPAPQVPPDQLQLGDKTIDFQRLELVTETERIPLTLMETNFLRYLVQREGQTVSRREILENVWGVREDTDTRAIDNFIVRLRRYLEPEPAKPRYLITVRGVGYRFERDNQPIGSA